MNGAVHGAPTTTASTPVKKAPAAPGLRCRSLPTPCNDRPASNTPDRLSATASVSSARTATTFGDCSWKPQPNA